MKDNGNGTISDEATGLIWQKKTVEMIMTWEQAKAYCWELKLAGHYDWRLPTLQELLSVVDYTRYWPAINIEYFPDTISSFYWSSTAYARYANYAWGVDFGYGDDGYYNFGSHYVRAVRGEI